LDALNLRWLDVPAGGTVSTADALEALRLLRATPGSPDPGGDAARAIQARAHFLSDRLQDAVRELAPALLALVSEGADGADGVICTAAFGRLVAINLPSTHPASSSVLDQTLFAGVIDSLPPGHPLRGVTSDPVLWDVVRSEGPTDPQTGSPTMKAEGVPVLILGPADTSTPGHPRARGWYLLAEALRLTEGVRVAQRQKDAEFLEGLRVERTNRLNAFWTSDLGRAELLRREVELARKRGLVPAAGPVPDPDQEGADGEAELAREQARAEAEARDRAERMRRAEIRALRLMGKHSEAAELAAAHTDGAGGVDR
jgi:hypothetical protein